MNNDAIEFLIDEETGGVHWFWRKGGTRLTEQQAMVINASKLIGAVNAASNSLGSIADALNNIADAIRENNS